jgi:hypothetical protein
MQASLFLKAFLVGRANNMTVAGLVLITAIGIKWVNREPKPKKKRGW